MKEQDITVIAKLLKSLSRTLRLKTLCLLQGRDHPGQDPYSIEAGPVHPGNTLIQFSLNRPRLITFLMVAVTLALAGQAALMGVKVDTDPENMLSEHEAAHRFHDRTKKDFGLHDLVVLGVVNEAHPDGVFNPATLKNVAILTDFIATLADPAKPEHKVVARDLMAPGNVDNIEAAGPCAISLNQLMEEPPADREGALAIRDAAMNNPLLKGTLVAEDGKAIGIQIPITSKDFAYQVSERIKEKLTTMDRGDDQFHITGLPLAEDTFGRAMFIQMAVSVPLAMLLIFILLFFFFRKVVLIVSPIIIAMVAVIATMGLLVATGNTLHLMSLMVPVFIIPIAVVDSIHILSEFFDRYQQTLDRRRTIEHVMRRLFTPMLHASLTSSAGFASFAVIPIQPLRIFGVFVAIGIMLAWLLTMVFIPAYVMLLKEESLTNFGAAQKIDPATDRSPLNRHLRWLGTMSYRHAKPIIVLNLVILAIAVYGASRIKVNDNPVNWFKKNHEIRVADLVLNRHFGGSSEAYLVIDAEAEAMTPAGTLDWLASTLSAKVGHYPPVKELAVAKATELTAATSDLDAFIRQLEESYNQALDAVPADDDLAFEAWQDALSAMDGLRNRGEIFKRPDVLAYIERLQRYLVDQGDVGKSNSVVDLVKKVHQELHGGDLAFFRIPDSDQAVAECLYWIQCGHKPDDLWRLISRDHARANLWLQLKSGDIKDMDLAVKDVERFFADNEPPVALKHQWAGASSINVVWRDKLVKGMAYSLLSSFAVVFLMMALLFRSAVWGLLAMIPLTFTIAMIHGFIGLMGKEYDMPVALLSSLTLGLAVDFAIHFIARLRMTMNKTGDWTQAIKEMFESPGRAISRSTIVLAVGFTPLMFASLVPCQSVGLFLTSITLSSGLATMWLLPSVLTILRGRLCRSG